MTSMWSAIALVTWLPFIKLSPTVIVTHHQLQGQWKVQQSVRAFWAMVLTKSTSSMETLRSKDHQNVRGKRRSEIWWKISFALMQSSYHFSHKSSCSIFALAYIELFLWFLPWYTAVEVKKHASSVFPLYYTLFVAKHGLKWWMYKRIPSGHAVNGINLLWQTKIFPS